MSIPAFNIGSIKIAMDGDFFIMAGPCVIEDQDQCVRIAFRLKELQEKTGISIMFKASFDKANRSSISSYRGPGLEKGLEILKFVKQQTGLAVVTDVHDFTQPSKVAEVADCIQIPAFLCRQTDLLVACGKTGKPVNVKKGQFVSPEEMVNVIGKVCSTGNNKILLTERGTFFGYNRLVNDMTAIYAMQKLGCPVVFDATHSTQQPGGLGFASAGSRELAPLLARSAVAAGANGLFLEIHENPEKAMCDAACVLPIDWVEKVLLSCKRIFDSIRENDC